MRPRLRTLLVLGLLTTGSGPVFAQGMRVGTKEAAPFAVRGPDGQWSGLSIELWRQIADSLALEYTFVEGSVEDLLASIEAGDIQAAVAALTITADRESRVDFTHPFFESGLGVAAAKDGQPGWFSVLRGFVSGPFWVAVLTLVGILVVVGGAMWLFERGRSDDFARRPIVGLGAAMWWSAVTMTTVGYGDKTPHTLGGRLVALVWMFASVLLISGVTAAIASALTVAGLGYQIDGVDDLRGYTVAAVEGTTGAAFLERHRISHSTVADVAGGFDQIASDQLDLLVHDRPILRYFASRDYRRTSIVLDVTFERQDYGIALTAGSPLREQINRVLLGVIRTPEWDAIRFRYLGS